MLRDDEFRSLLSKILDVAIAECGAIKGNVQLLDTGHSALCIEVQRGFDASFLQLFEHVRVDDPSACGRAFRQKQRVVIQDVMTDPLFAPYHSIARANRFRSVQSTPILANDGSVLGVFSTHFENANQFSEKMAGPLDRYASRMARLIAEYDVEKCSGGAVVQPRRNHHRHVPTPRH
jgi:GAF domain-containing protein